MVHGEYQHKGPWRRGNFTLRRLNQMTMTTPPEVTGLGDRLLELNDRANHDPAALAEREDLLDRHPLGWGTGGPPVR